MNSGARHRSFAGVVTALALSLASAMPAAAGDSPQVLTLRVQGLKHERGQVVANLFREGDDVMKHRNRFRQVLAPASGGEATLSFRELAWGRYAIVVFHDENGNGELDHNMFRFPAEPLGFSNNFRLGPLSGLPTFDKLGFSFSADTGAVDVVLE